MTYTHDQALPAGQQATPRRFDGRTLAIMVAAALLGVAWAYYNYLGTDGQRGEAQLRPLVWTIFATPFALFIGWTIARRAEVWLAAFSCFCLYFFTVFVAARIESLVMTPEAAAATNHNLYFNAVLVLHVLGSVGLATWRALQSPVESSSPAASASPAEAPARDTQLSNQAAESTPDET